MTYKIQPYTYQRAKELGVIVVPSLFTNKKIDVLDRKHNFICSVGASGYYDYPTHIAVKEKEYADERKRLYKMRHKRDRHITGSKGYYADNLFW